MAWLVVFHALGIAVVLVGTAYFYDGFHRVAAIAVPTLAAGFVVFYRRPISATISWYLLFLVLGILNALSHTPSLPVPPGLTPFIDRPDTLYIGRIVRSADFYPHGTRFGLRIETAVINGKAIPIHTDILLTVHRTKRKWLIATRLMTRLTLRRFHDFGTPGTFDYARFQAFKGLYARANLADDRFMVPIEPDSTGFLTRLSKRIRAGIDARRQAYRRWIKASLSQETFPLCQALLLGYRHELTPTDRDSIRRSGVSHLLAISGLHLGFVALSVFFVVQWLLRLFFPYLLHHFPDRHPAWLAAVLASFAYALLSGLTVPTLRAAVMALLAAGALISYRKPDPATLLAAAALIILVGRPSLLQSVSFQLSFGALFGILLFWPHYSKLRRHFGVAWKSHAAAGLLRIARPFSDALWISICVNLLILPLVAYHFQGISLAGFVANILLVPFVGLVIIPCGLAALILQPLHSPTACLILSLVGREIELALSVIHRLAQQSWSYQWLGNVPMIALISYYAAIIVCHQPLSRKRKTVLLIALVGVCLSWHLISSIPARKTLASVLEVDFIDVGQGSSAFVRFPKGFTMLVDGGGFFDQSFDVGRHVIAPFLWYRGIRRLDRVILTHDHPDHRNGLLFVLNNFDVGEYWETGFTCDRSGVSLPAQIARRRHIPILKLDDIPKRSMIDGCRVWIRHPSERTEGLHLPCNQLNKKSLVLDIHYGATRLILPGDIDAHGERKAFSHPGEGGRVLLFAPHHGSAASCSTWLLDILHPTAVVISCGYQNRFGFPSKQVLGRLRRRHIPVYRTDLNGTVTGLSDGLRWKLHCYSNAFAQY